MHARRIAWMTLTLGFVAVVVHASAANQCPASALGACARLHAEFMRPRTPPPGSTLTLAAPPMRAASERG